MKITDILESQNPYQPQQIPGVTELSQRTGGSPPHRMWLEENVPTIRRFIQDNCGAWLQKSGGRIAYRGSETVLKENGVQYPAFVRKTRMDRIPRDSSRAMHKLLNYWISLAGGKANRTNSLFLTGDPGQARDYGELFVVLPIGDFHYTWNTQMEDWHDSTEDALDEKPAVDWLDRREVQAALKQANIPENHPGYDLLRDETSDDAVWMQRARDVFTLRRYLNLEDPWLWDPYKIQEAMMVDLWLRKALSQGNEVMVKCNSYVMVEEYFYEEYLKL